jgi:DNA-binding GntR family transcriptional regulator
VQVQRNLDEASALVDKPDHLPRFIALGLRFHADLATGCGNRLLAGITAQLVDVEEDPVWTLLNQSAMRTPAARQRQVDEHAAVLDAVLERRVADAESAMRWHLESLNIAILHPVMAATSARSSSRSEE